MDSSTNRLNLYKICLNNTTLEKPLSKISCGYEIVKSIACTYLGDIDVTLLPHYLLYSILRSMPVMGNFEYSLMMPLPHDPTLQTVVCAELQSQMANDLILTPSFKKYPTPTPNSGQFKNLTPTPSKNF